MNDDKFKFVEVEVLDEPSENSTEIKKEETVKEEKKDINPITDLTKKFYFSFEARIIISVVAILMLFAGGCFLGYKVINHTSIQKVKYVESCDFSYQVCMKNSTCAPENSRYNTSDINIVKVAFKYNAEYEEKINVDTQYKVVVLMRSYNKKDHSLLFEKRLDMVPSGSISSVSKGYLANEIVTCNFEMFKDVFKDNLDDDNEVEIGFFVDENNESRKVASLTVPYFKDNAELTKISTNAERLAEVKVNVWDTYTLLYGLFASALTIVSLILIYKTTRLVLKVTNNKNEYESAVDSVLKQYDSIIVVARDGYESLEEREIVKLDSIEELVKIRDELNKPIIFSKVNNVKCEFIVEDEKILYKHVMKEADFTEDDKNKLENK